MPPPEAAAPPEKLLGERIDSVARRLRTRFVMRACGLGALVGTSVTALSLALSVRGAHGSVAAVLGAAAAAAAYLQPARPRWRPAAAARAIEAARPESRNVVITAEELRRMPDRARSWIRSRVFADAARAVDGLAAGAVVPLFRDGAALGIALAIWTIAAAGVVQRLPGIAWPPVERAAPGGSPEGERPPRLVATVFPPAYLAEPTLTLENPDRINAVRGSRLVLSLQSAGTDWRIRFGSRPLPARTENSAVTVELPLVEDGYLAIERPDAASARRLVPVTISPDGGPAVRIEMPARDLLVTRATGSLRIEASARDDHALHSLELRYTKVSGSGEQFTFREGVLALEVNRDSAREWKGRSTLALSAFGLEPGDALVYRAVGRDGRGDEGLGSSETYFVEVAGPGQAVPAGFELPPDRERYAFSQQMIVLKIERLRSRERSMPRDTVAGEAADIAAEQRAVRAHFVFLTGGHVEDEEEEAAHSHEIQEGRLENTARREIGLAIRHMTLAEQALVAVRTGDALPSARAAVGALQRAFGRNRYLLRTLPVRSRLDPSRRLSGDARSAADWSRMLPAPDIDPAARAGREILTALLDLAERVSMDRQRVESDALASLAERALGVDPAAETWTKISRGFLSLRDAVDAGLSAPELMKRINEIMPLVSAEAQRHSSGSWTMSDPDHVVRGIWAEERNRR
ncbi:MAG TPA: hypothetical protein VLD67_03185 [Vicinamibacterales bacterium]|nr:hypothetical protein [Vicinamibacterales bacterium]